MVFKRIEGPRRTYVLAGAVAVLVFALYLPVLQNDFVLWDDDRFVYNNFHIRSLDWTFLKWAFTDITVSHWRPLVWISHALDYSIWGMNPMGHHLTNVLLHSANTFIVVYLIIRLLDAANRVRIRHCLLPSLTEQAILITGGVSGTLFGLHPLHVESVAWITERKDVLYSLFFLLSMSAYIKYVDIAEERALSQKEARTFFLSRQYLLALFFFVFALSSKPMAVTLPFVFLILDWYPFRRLSSLNGLAVAFKEKLPFMTFSVLISVVTFIAQKKSGAMSYAESVQLPERVLVAFKALIVYLWKMLVPVHLVPFYPYQKDISLISFEYAGAIAVVISITVACIVAARKRGIFLAVWGYYVISLLPVLGIIRTGGHAMADRYTYLPSLGPFLLMGLFVAWGWAKVDIMKQRKFIARLIVAAIAVLLVSGMSLITLKQIAVWKNSLTLWSRVIDLEPLHAPAAYVSRGWAFKEAGQIDRALADFNKAIALDTAPPYHAYNNRGIIYRDMGQLDQALKDLNMAVTMHPQPFLALSNRGIVFGMMGMYDEAIADFSKAISLNLLYVDAYIGRGLVLQNMGRLDEAMEDLSTAVQFSPYNGDAYLNRGVVYERMGQLDMALKDCNKAIELNSYDYMAYGNRGSVLSKMGKIEKAIEDYSMAISLNSEFSGAYIDRGNIYLKRGDEDLALRDFKKACEAGSKEGCEAASARSAQ